MQTAAPSVLLQSSTIVHTAMPTVCIVGLGYVGLPLAHAFGKSGFKTYGIDKKEERIAELREGIDRTNELTTSQLGEAYIEYSLSPSVIGNANVIILAIPTPVDAENHPDLSLLREAAAMVGKELMRGTIVVSESTVYPGVTEEILGPIIEKHSGLVCGRDFKLGYSPERVNPGDRRHAIDKVVKVVAGQDDETTDFLVDLYRKIIPAGVYRAPSIKVAEMAKAIENAQRDLNIAYINEVAMLCNKIGIPTKEVLQAASTKWSFIPFEPGLVGGHCIGVDPYYLVAKARQVGMETHVITAGRATNDGMPRYVVMRVLEKLRSSGKEIRGARILVMGLTFKENVPDTRNSKAWEVVKILRMEECIVSTHDPFVEKNGALKEESKYDVILLLVPHDAYREMTVEDFSRMGKDGCIFYDLKSLYDAKEFETEGLIYLAL